MKKLAIYSAVVFMMILCTFGAGCISDSTTDSGNNSDNEKDSYRELYNAGKARLDGLLAILENPTADPSKKYVIEEVKVTKKEWLTQYVTIVVHDGDEYEGHGYDLKNNVIVNMGDILRVGNIGFVIKDSTITEDYGIIIHTYNEKNQKYRAGYLYYFTPSSYEEFKTDFVKWL